ncbi:hypothetical protein KKH23_04325 [Patescibacteria group bacterium]|nr:hypothetical protein [Patescibacteria group bacterium]
MICRKCGAKWFIEEIPLPEEVECPSCGELISLKQSYQPYQPRPPLDPDVITDIIIECFHLDKSRGLPVLYAYSEKILRYLKRIGYKASDRRDHVLYMKP